MKNKMIEVEVIKKEKKEAHILVDYAESMEYDAPISPQHYVDNINQDDKGCRPEIW